MLNIIITVKMFKCPFTISSSRLEIPIWSRLLSTKTAKDGWKSVVGLEIHAQILSASKLFSGSKVSFGAPLNTSVALLDASLPGTLPVLNKKCVEAGVKTAIALDCHINAISMFDRKHYFYADLPAGYQITQQRRPLAIDGTLTFPVCIPGVTKKPYYKSVRLHQLQLEQDSGKSLHDDIKGRSLVDLNRAGMPLMELVFEPELSNGEEAACLVKELMLILRRLNTCTCRMEEGGLRVDANVSIHQKGEPLGTRTEIKNIGSVRSVAQAVEYEIKRQMNVLNEGGTIHNETRSWDAVSKKTISMRDKEIQQDYRFMPEPNLLPLYLEDGNTTIKGGNLININDIRNDIPELPEETRKNLVSNYNLPLETAIMLVNEPSLYQYFCTIMSSDKNLQAKSVSNVLLNDLLTLCNKNDIDIENCKISAKQLIEIFDLMRNETINLQIVRLVLQELHNAPEKTPTEIIQMNNWTQINNVKEIEEYCKKCLENNSNGVKQYKNGKKKVIFAFAGDVLKITNQRANMSLVMKKLKELLDK